MNNNNKKTRYREQTYGCQSRGGGMSGKGEGGRIGMNFQLQN